MRSQEFINSDVFLLASEYLEANGYGTREYVDGCPLSVMAGDPVHVRFPFVGPMPANSKTIDRARERLQYAKCGFTLTDHGGYVTIKHNGIRDSNQSNVAALTALATGLAAASAPGGPELVTSVPGFVVWRTQTAILVQSESPTVTMTVAGADELIYALTLAIRGIQDQPPT